MPESFGKDDRRRWRSRSVLGAVATVLVSTSAHAGPSDINVRLACPVLSDSAASEFEARAKVDLSARAVGGTLEVVCVNLSAQMRWGTVGATVTMTRAILPASEPAALVDALLVAAAELVEEGTRRAAETPETPARAAPAEPVPDGAALALARREAGLKKRTAVDDSLATRSDEEPAPRAPSAPWLGMGIAVGGHGALDPMSGSTLAGPQAAIYLNLPSSLIATMRGTYAWGGGAGEVIQVRSVSGSLLLGYVFGKERAYEIGAGGTLGTLLIDAAAPYSPSSVSETYLRGDVYGRYGFGAGAWRFSGGPDLQIYGVATAIVVNGQTAWQLPAVSAGLSLEVSAALYGTR